MKIGEFLKSLSLKEYISLFDRYWDRDKLRVSPMKLWPKQEEYCDFIEKNKIYVSPKARQNGISEMHASRALKQVLQDENQEIVVISKSESHAKYFLDKRIRFKYKNLPKHPGISWPRIEKDNIDEIIFDNGSSIKSITSSSSSAASMTLDALIIDEAGGIDENGGKFEAIWMNALPAIEKSPNSWCAVIGTSVPGSFYNEMVMDSYKGVNGIPYFFLPYNTDPSRTEEWWEDQHKIHKDGMYLQYPKNMDHFFYVKEGLVFKSFDAKEGGRHVKHKPVNWNNPIYIGYDHGFLHPAGCLFCSYDEYTDHLHVFDEIYLPQGHQTSVSDIAEKIKKAIKALPAKPHKMIADNAIFRRDGVQTPADIFRKNGVAWGHSEKYDEKASRDLLIERFGTDRISISPNCSNLIEELRSSRWDTKKKEEKVIDSGNDLIDPLRYICNVLKSKKVKPDYASIIRGAREYNRETYASGSMRAFLNNNSKGSQDYSWLSG